MIKHKDMAATRTNSPMSHKETHGYIGLDIHKADVSIAIS